MTVKCTKYDSYMTEGQSKVGPRRGPPRLFHSNRFCQVTWLIDVGPFDQGDVIGE
ncbi:Uncharacterised protein [Pantoea agglomerans]|uniref:Uncharacterized protein n=1 Tax=Enterobacter agglomerans TaxID=549 RepID=A0A379A9I4_ENTAG|nr:Uncharacterised protein [Pantoea agglomerans]